MWDLKFSKELKKNFVSLLLILCIFVAYVRVDYGLVMG